VATSRSSVVAAMMRSPIRVRRWTSSYSAGSSGPGFPRIASWDSEVSVQRPKEFVGSQHQSDLGSGNDPHSVDLT
jgi:hypothetical protein